MKKLILSVTAIAGFSLAGFAQGTITFDGSNNLNTSPAATSGGQVFIGGVLDSTIDINAELLGGTSAGSVTTPIVTLLLSSSTIGSIGTPGQILSAGGDVTGNANGTFFDNNGLAYSVPGVAAGGTGYFVVEAWLGDYSSLAAAKAAGADTVTTAVFSEALVANTSPIPAVIDQMPALNLVAVPEPSTLAMAGVGLASMLLFRRKNS
jgi:hypothetical protein